MGSHKVAGTSDIKTFYGQWLQFRLFSAPHISKCSYIDAQSHQPVLWWFLAGCLPGWASWSHLQTTWASVDARQDCEWGLSKSRLLKLWQWYKHELLVYCCICRMTVKSETWNCVCIRPFLANLVTSYICNMGRSDFPDMYARARGRTAPEGECRHIRQITTAHVTYVM